mgnify:CR=1 FL=1
MTHDQQSVMWALNASGSGDLGFWTEAELWQESDIAAATLCRDSGMLAEVLSDITLGPQTSTVSLPVRCVRPLAVFHKSTDEGTLVIRQADPATVPDLEARGDSWRTEEATFFRQFAQQHDDNTLHVFPRMPAGRTVAVQVVGAVVPATLNSGSPVLALPEAIRPYLNYRTLAAARDREGPGRMPEVSAAMGEMAELIGATLGALWGDGGV